MMWLLALEGPKKARNWLEGNKDASSHDLRDGKAGMVSMEGGPELFHGFPKERKMVISFFLSSHIAYLGRYYATMKASGMGKRTS